MAFIYKNPTANVSLSAPEGVSRTTSVGTNFSVSQIGGYQEVFYLENLQLQFSGTGLQQLSANTIPINITVGNNAGLSWTTLSLNSDNISSGRRKLGMLVYVYETDTTYQYTIDNYDTLYGELTGLTGNSGLTIGATSTVVNARSQAGRDFINTWTGSTIEGQNGVTRENALWKIYYGPQVLITGGTYDSGATTLNLVNTTGGTISITGFTSDGGTTVTGGTYDHTTGELTLNNSDDTSVTISGIIDVYTTGGTLNAGNLELFDSTGGTQTITGFTLLEYVTYDETLNLDTGSRLIDEQPLSGYSMVQYNYVLGDGSNYRSGTFTITSDRNNISYSEICTQSVGYTKDVVLSAITNSGNIEFRGAFPSDDWQINFVRTTVPVINLGPIPSLTPTPTPTNSPQPVTPSVTPTSTVTPSVTPTITPTQSVTPSISVTPTITPTQSVTPSISVTPTITPTASITPSVTPTITPTPSITPTQTPGYLQYELGATESWPPGGPYTVTWTDPYGNPASYSFSGNNEVVGYTFCAIVGSVSVPIQIEVVTTSPCTVLPSPTPTLTPSVTNTITPTPTNTSTSTNTPTPSVTNTVTPTQTPTQTPSQTVTNTPTPTVTPTNTPTSSLTPTVTPSVTPSPVPVTGYGFNLVVLPYNFPTSGNTIMTDSGLGVQTGTTNPNLFAGPTPNGIYWSNVDIDGINRDSYFSQFTGQSVTFTISQNGSTAIYSGDSNSIQSWSFTGGTGYVFAYGIQQPGYPSSGDTILIQSATTQWVTGQTVYISAEINVPVTPTPTPSVTPTITPTESLTPTPTVTPTVTPTNVNTFQIFNNTTGRTVTDALINSVSVPLTSGSYPINSGQQGFALTHNSISTNELQYTFGGSGLFDIVVYKNGVIELSLTSYNNSLLTVGSLTATPTDIIVLIISDSE